MDSIPSDVMGVRSAKKGNSGKANLHDANNSPYIITKIVSSGDDVSRVAENLPVICHPGEKTNNRHRWPGNQPNHGSPYHEESHEPLDLPYKEHHPGSSEASQATIFECDKRIEET